ncbi:MAG: N-6 DNA methylase, partial [Terriglobia bacterium]
MKGLETSTAPFSNKTDWTLRKVYEEDHALLEANFRAYINGFSKNVNDIIEHFNYRATISVMVKNNRLAPILNQYKELALGPDQLSGLEMGYIYEELLRRFSEQSGEEAGDHFTPREVIRLMVELLEIPIPDRHFSIYDRYGVFQHRPRPLECRRSWRDDRKTYDYYGASGVIDKVEAYLFDGTYILIAEDGANLLTRSKTLAFLATGKFWVNNHAHILK